jgi:hypothetical protein
VKLFEVTVQMGTPLWSRSGFDFRLGTYRWLWTARLAAWWHVQKYPWRSATVLFIRHNADVEPPRERKANG